jgi:hypothetical protein
VAVVTARVDGTELTGRARVYFGINRAEEGAPFTASGGGGCSQASGRPGAGHARDPVAALPAALALLFLGLAAAAAARRV